MSYLDKVNGVQTLKDGNPVIILDSTVDDVFGLTGQALTADDPGADKIPFWDDSAGKMVYATIGDGLVMTGTTLTTAAAPTGLVMWFAANAAPTGYLKANGATISRTTYAALFAAIGTTWGVGDGSTTFTIPDLRGEFIRGWDDSRGIDSGRSFGSGQGFALQSHNHYMANSNSANRAATSGGAFAFWTGSGWNTYPTGDAYNATTAAETRPRNIALLACIKF